MVSNEDSLRKRIAELEQEVSDREEDLARYREEELRILKAQQPALFIVAVVL